MTKGKALEAKFKKAWFGVCVWSAWSVSVPNSSQIDSGDYGNGSCVSAKRPRFRRAVHRASRLLLSHAQSCSVHQTDMGAAGVLESSQDSQAEDVLVHNAAVLGTGDLIRTQERC